jgi:hypothetical protein
MIDGPAPIVRLSTRNGMVLLVSERIYAVSNGIRPVIARLHHAFSAFPSPLDKDHGPVTLHLLISPHLLLLLLPSPHPNASQ